MTSERPDYDSVEHLWELHARILARYGGEDADTADLHQKVNSFSSKFKFLSMFLGYTQRWSDAHEVVPNLDSLLIKIAIAAQAFREELLNITCVYQPTHFFLATFTGLNEKIELLKPEISEAYLQHLSSHNFHPLPPSAQTSDWHPFLVLVMKNLSFIRKEYNLVGPLWKRMKAFNKNLKSFLRFIINTDFPHCEVVIQAAHVCCWFFYTGMDQNGMAMLLADLQHKIDLASPEFFERILEFLQHHQKYNVDFVREMLHVSGTSGLENRLVSLLTCALKSMETKKLDLHWFSKHIKPLFVEARSLGDTTLEACKTGHVVLFARIWFLEAEIFLKEQQPGGSSTLLSLSIKDQVKFLYDESNFLRESLTPQEKLENQMLELIEQIPKQVDYLYESSQSHAKGFIPSKIRDVLYKFLVQMMLFSTKELLSNLIKSHESFTFLMKRQIGTLHEELTMVIEIVFNQFKEITEDERLTLTCIEELASGVTSLCNSFPADEITEEAMNKMGLWLFDLLERVQTLQAKLKELYLQVPMLNFPKTPALGFIEFLQQKLKQLLKWNPDSVAHLTNRIETISEDFEFLISHLIDFKEKGVENHGRKELCTRLIHVAHEAEYAIDSLVVKSGDEWNQFLWLYHISEEIRLIKMQVRPFQGKAIAVGVQNAVQTTRHEIPRTRATGTSEDVLILNDQQKEIVNLLKRESTHRDVISIVGMPGIGKTTLANQVYNDPEIVGSFHIRAWCYVSQVYTKRDLLLEILSHNQPNDKIHAMEDEDLELLLYQSLRRNRYLIFLDDVWDIGVWDNLQCSFPNDQNGSKILITSRLSDVVSKVTPESDLVKLRPLSDDESWELLRMKIFPEKRCPEKLREVGREIAEKCQGLPLSVVAIASLLKGRKMKPESWKQIVRSLNPRIIDDPQTRCMEIFELSYKNLPDYLKACFLYLAVFQEDKEIPVQKLTWLWMAEGFIQEKNSKSLEDLAEDYLIDLIGRSLITVAKRRSDGGVKSCRLHHLVRALCLLKAKKENFLEFITSDDKPYASFDDDLDLEEFEPSYPMNYDGYRLSISTRRNHFVMSTPSGSYVRTLLFFATGDTYPRCPYDISFISRNFKLLKVLDLECINMGNLFAAGIDLLLHLIYLAVGGDIDCIPSSLANLRNLESFLVKGLKGKVILPDAIWHMARLRHVRVKDRLSFNLKDLQVGISTQLNNLVSLSSVSLSPGEHAEEIIRRLPNVRKLSCIILRSRNYSVECIEFPRFERLTELMALKISYRGKGLNVSAFDFPKSLKKLSLSNFFLRGYHISKIGSLSNLEVLKLRSIVFKHTNWRLIKGKFRQLKCLKLESVNIVKWKANSERLPSLQHLVLRRCENLKKVPVDFVKIETLQIIEVQGCRESVEISLRRLKEEELHQYGTDILKVLINH
ncbi:putative late blight resistance protein homolog R1A-4 [Coffea arabica]|uniref:Late blight resistance protein homolog R1A-4 n=1 Tax=Coffea arabica TaxID=13443 RepID=A0A6P6VCT2_COFAR|nr:putative late blight resistance protein homolog R1A-4 isoform X1 [Coffea arabica]